MYAFLKPVSDEALKEYVLLSSPFVSFDEIEGISREGVLRILFSLFSYDLLYDKKARRMLLLTLADASLRDLGKNLKVDIEGSKFDVAMAVSSITWRTGSKVVKIFSVYFSISDDYLPSKKSGNATVDIVEPFSPLPSLFDYQEEMVTKLNEFLTDSCLSMALVQLPTGAGKTRTVMSSLADFANKKGSTGKEVTVLWLAHTEELCEQALEAFRRTWQAQGTSDKKVVRFWGSYQVDVEEMNRAFIVAGYQKITNFAKRNPEKFEYLFDKIDLVVIDEAHKSLAPSIKAILNQIKKENHAKVVGLTATPGRGIWDDVENKLLANLFDNNLLSVQGLGSNPIDTLQDRGILSKVKREILRVDNKFNLGNKEIDNIYEVGDFSSNILKRLAEDIRRNELIVSKIFNQINQGNQTLVFACSVEHAKKLSLSVSMRGGASASVDCTMRRNQRRRVINDFKEDKIKVLMNYGVLSTGFDAPNIKTIIITRPTTSIVLYSQMIGRGLRGQMMGGSEECTLVDVVDNFINFGKPNDVYEYFSNFWK